MGGVLEKFNGIYIDILSYIVNIWVLSVRDE